MARRRHRKKRVVSAIEQLPWQSVQNPYSPMEVLSADQVETIIESALEVLEKDGMRFLDAESSRLLQRAGANAGGDDGMLSFDRDMVR